jgi:molybdate/tungstate transport system permease protein
MLCLKRSSHCSDRGGCLAVVKKSEGTGRKSIIRYRFLMLFTLLGLVIVLFILIPLAKVVFLSDKEALWQALLDPTTINSILLTLYASLITTAIGFVFGVPLAYMLARYDFPLKSVVEGLIDLPIVVPHTAAGIALLFVFGRNYLLGRLFGTIGVRFVDSLAGIVVAMLFVSVPFLINSAKEGFKKVDVRLEKVSRTLGASPWQVFYRVTFPLAWRGVLAGNLMMWARGISEFGAVVILAYYPMVTPTLIYQRFESYGLNQAVPVAAILVIICAFIFIGVRTLLRSGPEDD